MAKSNTIGSRVHNSVIMIMCSYETDLDNNGILNRYFVSGVSICGWYLESVFALGIVIIHSIVSCIFSPFLQG